jgi:hypothetical protein
MRTGQRIAVPIGIERITKGLPALVLRQIVPMMHWLRPISA